jgi:hypothetical protein
MVLLDDSVANVAVLAVPADVESLWTVEENVDFRGGMT